MALYKTKLRQGIAALGLEQPPYNVSADTQSKLIRYIELIDKWNKHFNLTAVRELDDMVTLHLLDCLAVVPYINGQRILDVGAGAGLPGLVLAMVFPDKQFTLLDSNGKKTRFMTQAKIELGLGNVEVVQSRIDEYQVVTPFDVIISRAFASISDMLGLIDHLVSGQSNAASGTDTLILAMKGDSTDEITQMPESLQQAYQIDHCHKLVVPGLEASRELLEIRHI